MATPTNTIFIPYHAFNDLVLRGTRAAQPAATAVVAGAIYCVSDEDNLLERSTGSAWEAFSPTGATGMAQLAGRAGGQTLHGGTAAADDLVLRSTSHGAPSGDEIVLQVGTDDVLRCIRNPSGGGQVLLVHEAALKFTFLPASTHAIEAHIGSDRNFAVSRGVDEPTGIAFQGYNDAVGANIPFEFRGLPLIFSVGAVVWHQVVTPAALAAGANNNYNPTGLDGAQVLRLAGDVGGTSQVTGMVPTINGVSYRREVKIFNQGTSFTIEHEHASSTAANRFLNRTNAAITIVTNSSASYWYDTTSSRWRQSA